MNLRFWSLCLLFSLSGLNTVSAAKRIDFNRDLRPVLSDKCFFCHGPDGKHREAGLRLDVGAAAKKEAIVPGNADASPLIGRIFSHDQDELMPPPESGKRLSDAEKAMIRDWINQGAEYQEYWAYVRPQSHDVPGNKGAMNGGNWIDSFITVRLKEEGLAASPSADQITLIRRLCFDLTGLPPTPAEVDAFVNSKDAKAYEVLVERLLNSERFGERLAMYWLDLVRYADTVGYHGDQDHAITPYRDYVIDSFNRNKPFDVFTKEQLAGDLIPDAGMEQKIASGYNRLLQTSHEGGVQAKEYLAIYAADRVRNISAVWMGATVGCAQCHDHKYDPYTIKDFYSMAAFFADIDEDSHLVASKRRGLNFNALPTPRPPEILVGSENDRTRFAQITAEVAKLAGSIKSEKEAEKKTKLSADKKAPDAELGELGLRVRKTMITVTVEPRIMRVLPRGNWLDDSGPVVHSAIPEFMGKLNTKKQRATRLDLANWLTDPDPSGGAGGLTARVFANRFWYLLFGSGLAGVLDDFGGQGDPPMHPDLLDNLAVEFQKDWDVKRLFKLILMSQTYRQSSLTPANLAEHDPLNRFYARQSRHRLDAEMVRDAALSVSGLLVELRGGGSVKPYQPAGYYRHLNFPTRKYAAHTDDRQWRRGLYMHWQRQYLHPMLKALDAPSREECTAQRPRSNTPVAALTLLNDPTFVEAARIFAQRVLREGGTSVYERMSHAYRLALSRSPDSWERDQLTSLLIATRAEYRKDPGAARELLLNGIRSADDGLPEIELAAWVMICRAILNLNEVITRN
ncbi:MAG: PSD1 and planctomycete cytochrome C domain-containing protein [Verrucomicrobiia bacterium]